jgi:hypothetical protein
VVILSPALRAVLRIEAQAEAAAANHKPTRREAEEQVNAYARLREEARMLSERAGWSFGEFDDEVPKAEYPPQRPGPAGRPGGLPTSEAFYWVSEVSPQARFLLRQLAAWCAGNIEAFQIEARLKAKAELEAAKRGRLGFGRALYARPLRALRRFRSAPGEVPS